MEESLVQEVLSGNLLVIPGITDKKSIYRMMTSSFLSVKIADEFYLKNGGKFKFKLISNGFFK